MEQGEDRGTGFKLAIVCLAILLMGSFWLTLRMSSEPVSLVVIPEAPRQGEPILVTFKLNNPTSQVLVADYQFYANGEFLMEGVATIAPASSKTYQYAYANPLRMGEQLNFVVRTQSELGNHEKVISSPPYPPQVWSSFVSFASFSTSVMSSMSTMTYYRSTFGSDMGLNVGYYCQSCPYRPPHLSGAHSAPASSENGGCAGKTEAKVCYCYLDTVHCLYGYSVYQGSDDSCHLRQMRLFYSYIIKTLPSKSFSGLSRVKPVIAGRCQ